MLADRSLQSVPSASAVVSWIEYICLDKIRLKVCMITVGIVRFVERGNRVGQQRLHILVWLPEDPSVEESTYVLMKVQKDYLIP